jgi:hypothetical protein
MITGINDPLTFIEYDPQPPFKKRKQRSIIRSHTSASQQKKRRERPSRGLKHPSITFVGVEKAASTLLADEASHQSHDGTDHVLPFRHLFRKYDGQCTCRTKATRGSHGLRLIERRTSRPRCAYCYSHAVVSALDSQLRSESHRSDPFDCLPAPMSKEVNTILDYCKTNLSSGINQSGNW